MAEHSTLGQNVQKSPAPPEGLFLMDGIEGLPNTRLICS